MLQIASSLCECAAQIMPKDFASRTQDTQLGEVTELLAGRIRYKNSSS